MKQKRITQFLLALILAFTMGIMPMQAYALQGSGTLNSPYDVEAALVNQSGATKTVTGVVVGQPTSSSNVIKSGFTNDYALALAMSSGETNTSKMVYVQIPSSFRSGFGLRSNPTLIGKTLSVTGKLTAYFSHAGVTSVSDIKLLSGGGNGTLDPVDPVDPIDPVDPGNSGGTTTPYDATYYKTAMGLTGAALKNQLHNIIDDHKELSYDQVWDALRYTDADPKNNNNVILLYTGRSQSKLANGGMPNDWNREHVWAKSHGDFGTSAGAGTDLHHLRPTDVSVNSARGSLDFDNGGSYHPEATECRFDNDSWEPRNSVKGDVARMLFYMAVRYEGDSGEVDLELNNYVNNGKAPYMGKLSILLAWHKLDPVDDFERNRNNVIFEKYQLNRNPFIDHPEWVEAIWN